MAFVWALGIGIELVLSLNCLAVVVVGIPSPTKFILPNREEKAGKKVLSQHFYKNALSQRLQQLSATEYNHPTTKPSTTTKHRNLAQKINPKSTEKQLENPTQNQDKPIGKPNPKTVQTCRKTQPKPYSTENSREMPNKARFAAQSTVIESSIAAT